MNPICWIDLETSGIDSNKCCILQLAALMDIDGKIVDSLVLRMKPDEGDLIEDQALIVTGQTREQIDTYPSQREGYNHLIGFLDRFVNKYDRNDKLIFAAYNASFDDNFLRQFFTRNRNKFFGLYFWWPKFDVATLVALCIAFMGMSEMKDFKLATVCERFGVPIEAHDALSDIMATRTLGYELLGQLGIYNAD
jgi:DNA polymerase-3 subunit epsilon